MAVVSIEFNGIKLDGGYSRGYILQPALEGLDKPEIRTAEGVYSGRDGGYVSNQLYGKRAVSIKGVISGDTPADYEARRKALMTALPIRQMIDFTITLASGAEYVLEAYVVDVQLDYNNQNFAEFKIDLVAPSPYIYDANGTVDFPIQKLIGGGYATPYSLPVTSTMGTQNANIMNTGDSVIFPEIVLSGKFTNPRILNVTTNQFIKLDSLTSSGGDIIIFDMQRRTITLNGGSILNKRTLDSSWWGLAVGNNEIELTSTDGADSQTGTIRYRVQYTGV